MPLESCPLHGPQALSHSAFCTCLCYGNRGGGKQASIRILGITHDNPLNKRGSHEARLVSQIHGVERNAPLSSRALCLHCTWQSTHRAGEGAAWDGRVPVGAGGPLTPCTEGTAPPSESSCGRCRARPSARRHRRQTKFREAGSYKEPRPSSECQWSPKKTPEGRFQTNKAKETRRQTQGEILDWVLHKKLFIYRRQWGHCWGHWIKVQ